MVKKGLENTDKFLKQDKRWFTFAENGQITYPHRG